MEETKDKEISIYKLNTWMQDETYVLEQLNSILRIPLQICDSIEGTIQSSSKNEIKSVHSSNTKAGLIQIKKELSSIQEPINKLSQELNDTLFIPLESFLINYKEQMVILKKKGDMIISKAKKVKEEVEVDKKSYWDSKAELKELLEKGKKSVDMICEKENVISDLKIRYANSIKEGNKNIEKLLNKYNKVTDSIFDIETSKAQLLQYSLEKTIKCIKDLGDILNENARSLSSCSGYFQADSEIQLMHIECKDELPEFSLLHFSEHPSEKKEQQIIHNNYFMSTGNKSEESIKDSFDKIVHDLMQGKELSLEEMTNMVELLNFAKGRELFAKSLVGIKSKSSIESEAAFRSLGQLINYMLTRFVIEDSEDYFIISSSLEAAEKVYLKVSVSLIILE